MSENLRSPWDELEREKIAFDEVISAFRAFEEKKAGLPPYLAKRVTEALEQRQQGSPAGPLSDEENPRQAILLLTGMTSLECARLILKEHGNQPMHFGAIAKEALERGYVGKPFEGTDQSAKEHRTAQSFWSMMHRSPTDFEKLGSGYFKLRSQLESTARQRTRTDRNGESSHSGRFRGESLAKRIVEFMSGNQRPMRAAEIARGLELAGVETTAGAGLLGMVLSALRKRPDLFERHSRGVYGLK